MQRAAVWLTGIAFIALSLTSMGGPARADGVPVANAPAAYLTVSNWTGAYVGVETGAGLGETDISNPYGASIFGDTVRTPGYLIGLEAGYNWQAPGSHWVFGAEGDIVFRDTDGTATCFATPFPVGPAAGMLTSSNCSADPDWTGTLTGRIGYATGLMGRTLLFAKGGVAFQHNDVDATTNFGFGVFPITKTSSSDTRWGWTLGAGVEQMITPAWSLKLEYDYLDFGSGNLVTPATFSTTPAGAFVAVPSRTASIDQTDQVVKLGLNYRLGTDPFADWPSSSPEVPRSSHHLLHSGWAFEAAARYYYSVGRFQKDLAAGPTNANNLISRLVYDDLTANAGELYGRVDTPWGIFVKGFGGGGDISGGHMNDEDWGLGGPPFTAYSNTISGLSDTSMNYLTVDAGIDVLHGRGYKVGAFAGYNYVYEQYAATDCTQIADQASGICAPPIFNTPVITETDHWNSLRLGFEGIAWLAPHLKLTADAAYLPYVKFSGVDNHWLRVPVLLIDETGKGQGAQIEAMLSYYFSPEFSVGLGGRYWMMWTTSGSDTFNGVPTNREDTFRYERAGVFLQATYLFDPPDTRRVPLK